MKIWNYIYEFFLFRWLFNKLRLKDKNGLKSTGQQSLIDNYVDDVDIDNARIHGCRGYSSGNSYNNNDYDWRNQQSYGFEEGEVYDISDDLYEEPDDFDFEDQDDYDFKNDFLDTSGGYDIMDNFYDTHDDFDTMDDY